MLEFQFKQKEIQEKHWWKDKQNRRSPDHPVVSAVYEPLAKIVASAVKCAKNASVLDVGCGNGFLQYSLQREFGEVTGLDYSLQMLQVNPCQRKHLGYATRLPFRDKSFDVAVAAHLLHHLTKEERILTLSEMRRVARSAVVSFEPNRANPLMFLFSFLKKEERMALDFSPSYMIALFKQAGLRPIKVHVEGWIVPNKAPIWYIPIGLFAGRTFLRHFGFDICSVGSLQSGA